MYKAVHILILFTLSMTIRQTDAFANPFFLPKLKCTYRQDQFFSELFFKKNNSRSEDAGFEGELRHYIVSDRDGKRFISGMAFKTVFYQKNGMISGLIGDEFGSTGSFSLTNTTPPKKSGVWQFTSTDISDTHTQVNFECIYK